MIRSIAKSLLQKFGLEVRRLGSSSGSSFPEDPFDAQKVLLGSMGVNHPTIFDVGANKGQTAKKYRSKFPNALIYCFEPFPDSVEALHKTLSDDLKIKVIPMAVADRPGTRKFHVNEFDPTNSLLPRPETARRYFPHKAVPKETIEVTVTCIDEFTQENGINNIDILKFDIQGGELMSLQGAAQVLGQRAVQLIYTEIMFIPHYEGGPLFYELWSYLADFQYSLFDIYNLKKATNGQIRYGDALFVGNRVRKQVIDKYPKEP